MKKFIKKLFFPAIGLLSLVWFLVRVIPKPSRASYPCMRAAAPLASSFVLYLIGLFSSVIFFQKARYFIYKKRYFLFSFAFLLSITIGFISLLQTDTKAYAYTTMTLEGPNKPMGVGKGINPGRVVWIYYPDATDETCTNTPGDYCRDSSNTNQIIVNKMVSDALQMLTNTTTNADAWDAIFHYYNKNHDKGDIGYKSGEKIVIKINLNTGGQPDLIDTSPEVCYAVLNQLIKVVGVAQSDIGIGDPGRTVDNYLWSKCHKVFPNVKYWGQGNGRTPIVRSANKVIFASDGSTDDWLPQYYLDASYMINIPVLKKHHRAGISLTSKNHFGSFTLFHNDDASHWHVSLPAPQGKEDTANGAYGKYRCLVDIMGHKDLGGKTILFLIDGLWSSTNYAHPPIKWRMPPFNNDWPSSIFMSQDPVAIQSVGFDFLFYEFDKNHPTEGKNDGKDNTGPFPHYPGVDDFLHQAADSTNWPDSIKYDPENDRKLLPASIGTHEHWNNAIDKQYSRNLGLDKGIELVTNYKATAVVSKPIINSDFILYQNYPNPFNPVTTIRYSIPKQSLVLIKIYDALGNEINTLVNIQLGPGNYQIKFDGSSLSSGIYFYQILASNYQETKKCILLK